MRRLPLSATVNTRALGGYPAANGRCTAAYAFLRSDLPGSVTAQDAALLRRCGFTTVIDLRNDTEVRRQRCALDGLDGFAYRHLEIRGGGRLPKDEADVPLSYFQMVDENDSILPVFRAPCDAEGAALYHCVAGKDRTGVVSALLLLLAGVPRPDILADYQATHAYWHAILTRYYARDETFPINLIIPRLEYMDTFLDMFLGKYRSAQDYFSHIGLAGAEIRRLTEKLTGAAY